MGIASSIDRQKQPQVIGYPRAVLCLSVKRLQGLGMSLPRNQARGRSFADGEMIHARHEGRRTQGRVDWLREGPVGRTDTQSPVFEINPSASPGAARDGQVGYVEFDCLGKGGYQCSKPSQRLVRLDRTSHSTSKSRRCSGSQPEGIVFAPSWNAVRRRFDSLL